MKASILTQYQGDVHTIVVENAHTQTLKLSADIQSQVDTLWEAETSRAHREGREVWNGQSIRLDTVEEHNGQLKIRVSHIWFKERHCLEVRAENHEEIDPTQEGRGLSIGGLIRTSDDWYIVGKQSQKTMSNDVYDIIGGIIDDVELRDGTGLYQELMREIEEESGIRENQVIYCQSLGIIQSSRSNCIIANEIKVDIDRNQVYAQFQENSDVEQADLIFIDRKNLKDFLKYMGGYKILLSDLIDVSPEIM